MARVLFLAPDLSEIAQRRRIASVRRLGHDTRSMSLSKGDAPAPDWENLPLGRIANERLGRRFAVLCAALVAVWRQRGWVREADLLIARNLDMMVLALAAQVMAGCRRPLVYECLDIHGLFTRAGPVAALARWIERRALARADLLVVSSPGFVTRYFHPVQRHDGPWHLLENKLWFPAAPPPRPALSGPARRDSDGRIVIGWAGAIRCQPSLDLLVAVARARPERVHLHIRGIVHRHALPHFDATIAALPNVSCGGPYTYPDGLTEVYRPCDVVWAQDLWQAGANSDWLLPNRIYEAGWFGCPAIALAGTETGRAVAERKLGWTINSATPAALGALLDRLTPARLAAQRAALLRQPDTAFCLTAADLAPALDLARTVPGPQHGATRHA